MSGQRQKTTGRQAPSTPGHCVQRWPLPPRAPTPPPRPRPGPHLTQHPQPQQALLLGCHHKVVGVILVVHNVLQINAWGDNTGGDVSSPPCVTSPNTQPRLTSESWDYSLTAVAAPYTGTQKFWWHDGPSVPGPGGLRIQSKERNLGGWQLGDLRHACR